jgi:hypothetical protein
MIFYEWTLQIDPVPWLNMKTLEPVWKLRRLPIVYLVDVFTVWGI